MPEYCERIPLFLPESVFDEQNDSFLRYVRYRVNVQRNTQTWLQTHQDDTIYTDDTLCSICYEPFHTKKVTRSECGHIFCTTCMISQFKLTDNGNQCALCRQTLMKDVAITTKDITITTKDIMQFIPVKMVRFIHLVVIDMVCWILWWWKIAVEAKVWGVGKHIATHRVY